MPCCKVFVQEEGTKEEMGSRRREHLTEHGRPAVSAYEEFCLEGVI